MARLLAVVGVIIVIYVAGVAIEIKSSPPALVIGLEFPDLNSQGGEYAYFISSTFEDTNQDTYLNPKITKVSTDLISTVDPVGAALAYGLSNSDRNGSDGQRWTMKHFRRSNTLRGEGVPAAWVVMTFEGGSNSHSYTSRELEIDIEYDYDGWLYNGHLSSTQTYSVPSPNSHASNDPDGAEDFRSFGQNFLQPIAHWIEAETVRSE